ncbi:hypothetical protein ACV3PA_16470 (plasmid) [Exiguobacterium acetylicum]|uniref:hypothetical protein n=1 Tax=Exiguobacterium sp. R-17 TaxID=3404054 RepID=UPI003CEB50E4
MNILIAEIKRSYNHYVKSIKFTLISILIMTLILFITLNNITNKLEKYHEIIVILISIIFFLRILVSSLTFPINQISQEKNNRRMYMLSYLKYSFEYILTIRILINVFLNATFSILFLLLIDLSLGDLYNLGYKSYLIIYVSSFIGMMSVAGVGLIVGAIQIATGLKMTVIAIAQIVLFFFIFSYSSGSMFVPFSLSKILIYNILNHYQLDLIKLITNLFYIFLNSLVYYFVGWYTIKKLRLSTIKNNKL